MLDIKNSLYCSIYVIKNSSLSRILQACLDVMSLIVVMLFCLGFMVFLKIKLGDVRPCMAFESSLLKVSSSPSNRIAQFNLQTTIKPSKTALLLYY